MTSAKLPPLTREVIAILTANTFADGKPARVYRPNPRPEKALVYFIGGEDGPIKIGFTNYLKHRLSALRNSSPCPLSVLASVDASPKLEREYHKRFAAHRLHGEWFSRHPDILAEIARLSPTGGR